MPLVIGAVQIFRAPTLEMREGLTETVMYLRKSLRGQPLTID